MIRFETNCLKNLIRAGVGFCLLVLGSACATTGSSARVQVNVGNGHPSSPVRNVKMRVDDQELPGFAQIAPNKVAASRPLRGEIPQTISIEWLDIDGNPHRGSVEVQPHLREDFRGQLLVEITRENQLTLTEVPSMDGELSTMPWALPESWEGSVQIPGMN